MARYLLRNIRTETCFEVEAGFAEQGCHRLGWDPAECVFYVLRYYFVTDLDQEPVRLGVA